MAYNHEYPYVDPNRHNSDWILNKIKELEGEMDTFEALNKITFSGEWNITKQYPAWTIVNDNNGRDGYISIKPVPAGVTIDNINYWRSVANYSDLIADLQNRVITLENTVGDSSNGLVKDVDDLKTEVSLMTNRKYIFIGDSYAVRPANWIDELVAMLGLSAGDYYNSSAGGYGFRGDTRYPGFQFINLLYALDNVITDKAAITDIVVAGGINDNYAPYDAGVLVADGDAFCAAAREKYPNAKIHIAFIGFSNEVTYLEHFPQTIRNYMEISENENCVFVDNVWNAFHYIPWLDDVVHPNASGMHAIARMIKNHLLGAGNGIGTPSQVPVNVTITPSGILSGYNQYTEIIASELFDGKNITLTILKFVVGTNGFAHTFDDNVYELATIAGAYLTGIGDIWVTAHGTAYDATLNKIYDISASISVNGGKLFMKCMQKDNLTVNNLTLNDVRQFVLYPTSMTFNGINS